MTEAHTDLDLNQTSPDAEAKSAVARRRTMLAIALLAALLLCLACATVRYLQERTPLTDLPPIQTIAGPVAPHYLFSFPAANPNGLAVTPGGDRIYVVQTLSGDAQETVAFDRSGTRLFSMNPPAELIDPFPNPVYAAIDRDGRVYVVDRIIHKIFIYGADGKFINTFPDPDFGDELPPLAEALRREPTYLDGNAATGFRVYDRAAHLISLFTPNGEPVEDFPASADTFWVPQGIAFDQNGNLYITEVTTGRHRVWIFDPQGIPVRRFGTQGQALGQFEYPNDVAIDSRGRLYISDTNNGRVQITGRSGRLIGSIGREVGVNMPQGVAIDRDRLYIVDVVGATVRVFDLQSDPPKHLFDFGELGLSNGQFYYPADIAFDSTGRIYISDRLNNRVQVWSY